MTKKTTPVPDELLRELKAALDAPYPNGDMPNRHHTPGRVTRAIDAIPDPPKPDPVEECKAVMWIGDRGDAGIVRNILRRYRELGCPEIDQ